MLDSLVRVSRRVGRVANRFATDPTRRFFNLQGRVRGTLLSRVRGNSWPHCLWQSVQASTPVLTGPPEPSLGCRSSARSSPPGLESRGEILVRTAGTTRALLCPPANVAPPESAKAIPRCVQRSTQPTRARRGGQRYRPLWGQAPSSGAFPRPGSRSWRSPLGKCTGPQDTRLRQRRASSRPATPAAAAPRRPAEFLGSTLWPHPFAI